MTKKTAGYEKALDQLQRNRTNRRVKAQVVHKYSMDMARGNWHEDDSNAISVDSEGNLLNGQHRLMAVVKSGATVRILTVRGASPTAQLVMDSGSGRSFSDYLHMAHGKDNAPVVAALARAVITLEAGRETISQADTTRVQMQDWIDEHPDYDEAVRLGVGYRNKLQMSPTAIALGVWIIHDFPEGGNDFPLIEAYLAKLERPVDEPVTSAVYAVMSRARRAHAAGIRGGGMVNNRKLASLLVKGWNYWATDVPIAKLTMTDKDKFPPKPVRYSR
jgi:hypothetical protein